MLLLAGCKGSATKGSGNVILLLVDGCSTSSLSAVRWYDTYTDSTFKSFNLDPYVCGLMRTCSVNSPIPGSPGAMSAIMTGQVTRSSVIATAPVPVDVPCTYVVEPHGDGRPLMTLLEAARHYQGKSVGMVATVEYWHATPAACSSHSLKRYDPESICRQMAAQGLDVLFAGGTDYLGDDIRAALKEEDITVIEQDIDAYNKFDGGKVWALFAPICLDYEIDRDTAACPSLAQMTSKALSLLSRNKKGFFLMVEGSKVDYAAHAKDPVGLISDINAFDEAVGVALDFARKDGNTTVVVVADHGTAGMTVGDDRNYNYVETPLDSLFGRIPACKASAEKIAHTLMYCAPSEIRTVFKEWTGIDITDAQEKEILARKHLKADDYMKVSYDEDLQCMVSKILNQDSHIGFVSGNHTGEDVFLAVYAPDGVRPQGWIWNVDLNAYMCSKLGLDRSLQELTDIYFAPASSLFGDVSVEEDGGILVLNAEKGGHSYVARQDCSYVEIDGERVDTGTPNVVINGEFFLNSRVCISL